MDPITWLQFCLLQVASFQCLQPFVGTLLAFAILGEQPSVGDLGAVGVIVGLITVAYDRKDQPLLQRVRKVFSMKVRPTFKAGPMSHSRQTIVRKARVPQHKP